MQADLTDAASARALAGRAVSFTGSIDILVNNAGIYPFQSTAETAEGLFDAVHNLNVKVPFFLTAELAPAMLERGHGSIINLSTIAARKGLPGAAAYGSSKAALDQLTRTWAPLRAYLRRLGYDARGWGLGINRGHPESDRDRSAAIVQDVATEHGPVGLVGWSLGAVIVREVARELPDHVDGVVLFGSPIIGGPTHTIAARAFDAKRRSQRPRWGASHFVKVTRPR